MAVREIAALLLAGVFLVAGGAKLFDPAGTRRSVRELGLPSLLGWPAAIVLPVLELVLAAGLVVESTSRTAAAAAAILLTLFAAVIGINVARGRNVDCGCFGPLHSPKAGIPAAARNGALALLALALAGSAAEPVGLLELGAALVLAAIAAQAAAWVVLLRRYGRLLARFDELELDAPHAGLAPGTDAPHFALADTHGTRVALDDLLGVGKPVLLAFVDARCGPCRALVPDLARWQRELAQRLTIAVVASGDAHAVRAMVEDNRLSLLVSPDGAVARDYETEATPSALVVDTEGRVASSLRYAADGVAGLVEEMVARMGAPAHA